MAVRTFCADKSTVSFRLGSLSLLLAFILHMVGYALPRWFTIHITVITVGFEGTYHMGLWQDCTCTPDCYCVARHEIKGWQRTVQAMQTLGLVGLTLSGILCIISLCRSQPSVKLKRTNIGVLICSGIFMLVGVTVFAAERSNEYEELTSNLETGAVTKTHLDSSFIVSVVATTLCLLLCLPLLMLGLRSTKPTEEQQIHQMNTISDNP